MRFVHAADIHLDSPRAGLERDAEAPAEEIQQAPRRALENLVRLCLDESVDFLLIAGDLYDGSWKDFRTGLFFVEQMARLQAANIPVILISGNHDAENKMTKTLRLPGNVERLPSNRPETLRLEPLQVAIHGQSFAKAAVLDDLSERYPAKVPGYFNIGLLHTCATSSEHERYAPCTVEGLQRRGYDYWALGHVHQRQSLHERGATPIHFPGNLQGRHIRETGPKGALLVTVDDRGEATTEFRPLDVFRWELCQVNAAATDRADDLLQRFHQELGRHLASAEERPLAVRVEVDGACEAHRQLTAEPLKWAAEFRAVAAQAGEGRTWIEKIVRRTTPPREVDPSALDGPLGEINSFLQELKNDDAQLRQLLAGIEELGALQTRLPAELCEGEDGLKVNDPDWIRRQLDDVGEMLIHRLLEGGARDGGTE